MIDREAAVRALEALDREAIEKHWQYHAANDQRLSDMWTAKHAGFFESIAALRSLPAATNPTGEATETKALHVQQAVQATHAPGNGTQYDVLAVQFAGEVECASLGLVSPGGWLVVCGLNGQAYLLQGKGYLHESYVAEKFELNPEDTIHITEMVRQITNRL